MNTTSAEIIAHSKAPNGKEIITMRLVYPRYIHGELMTHRVFSRNGSSSRAVPINKLLKEVWTNPVSFDYWGKNKPGMKAKEELTGFKLWLAKLVWLFASKIVCVLAYLLYLSGLHKQNVNRILEPFSWMVTIVTSTEWNNFYTLRDHRDAQPEIRTLAIKMKDCATKSKPRLLQKGEWHLPYVEFDASKDVEQQIRQSVSMVAQVSFRELDSSIERANRIYDKLINSKPVHSSPTEHQATPADTAECRSNNLIGWIQYRETIKDNYVKG